MDLMTDCEAAKYKKRYMGMSWRTDLISTISQIQGFEGTRVQSIGKGLEEGIPRDISGCRI
jgi:hypothetical protein